METKNWKWFRINDFFAKPYKALAYNAQELTFCNFNENRAIRYVTRTDTDNGCKGFVINDDFAEIEKGNAITIGDTTATIFYQEKDFICGDHMVILRSQILNKNRGLFFVSILNKERYRYNYGRSYKKDLIANTKIKLPIDIHGNPDWQWIENYVQNTLIPKLPQKTKNVWQRKFDTKPISPNKLQLNTKEWQWFTIDDGTKDSLFSVAAGKYHYPSEYSSGDTPYLSATAVNNGVGNCIDLDAEFEGNVVTTEKVGCTSFYQPKPFCATSDVNIITCKRHEINPYIGLFLASVIDFNENFRWTYGRQCRVGDTKAIRLKLPAIKNAQGEYEPNWQWMEDYIKGLPYSGCL